MARGSFEADACGGKGRVGSLPPKRSAAETQRLCAPTRSRRQSSDAERVAREKSGKILRQRSRGPSYCLILQL